MICNCFRKGSISGRSNQSIQVICKSLNYVVENFGTPLPVLITEALTFTDSKSIFILQVFTDLLNQKYWFYPVQYTIYYNIQYITIYTIYGMMKNLTFNSFQWSQHRNIKKFFNTCNIWPTVSWYICYWADTSTVLVVSGFENKEQHFD